MRVGASLWRKMNCTLQRSNPHHIISQPFTAQHDTLLSRGYESLHHCQANPNPHDMGITDTQPGPGRSRREPPPWPPRRKQSRSGPLTSRGSNGLLKIPCSCQHLMPAFQLSLNACRPWSKTVFLSRSWRKSSDIAVVNTKRPRLRQSGEKPYLLQLIHARQVLAMLVARSSAGCRGPAAFNLDRNGQECIEARHVSD